MTVSAIRRAQLNSEMFQLRIRSTTGEQVLNRPTVYGRANLLKPASSVSQPIGFQRILTFKVETCGGRMLVPTVPPGFCSLDWKLMS